MDFINTVQPVDPHSFCRPALARLTHVDWELRVDFAAKKITGKGVYAISHTGETEVVFDVNGLNILEVTLDEEVEKCPFTFSETKPFLGQGLQVPLKPGTKTVVIIFETTSHSGALQWLEPHQTAGKEHPFLFTQSQAILARTWLPCQDSPSVRFTYSAKVTVPPHMLPLMSAQNPQGKNATGEYYFKMEQPIPSYLLSLAVGNLSFAPVGQRCGVYAEPGMLAAATYEFAQTEEMLLAAEELYGPYLWERYDLLVLPPSFPFGGMENPRLTFATPTIMAGDRSLTSLVAHELAHSWSGNLVTNATWNDFWLNEGFTVYFERRIMEALYGKDYAQMLHTLGYQDLQQTLKELKATPQDTHLHLHLQNRDPDEGLIEIAYEKGNLFLCHLEYLVGREKFDAFVQRYFSTFQFQSMDTARFEQFLEKELLNGNQELTQKAKVKEWIYGPGIPEMEMPVPRSEKFDLVEKQLKHWAGGTQAEELTTPGWSSHEWLHFLRHLPETISPQSLEELDHTFHFTQTSNAEILAQWLLIAIQHQYEPAWAALENFLVAVGRRKFIMPLYKALLKSQGGTKKAREIYSKARPNYHAVVTSTLDALLHVKE